MSAAFWASLFALRDNVDQLVLGVGRRLADLQRSAEPETPVSGVVLARLHLEIRQELESWSSLALAPVSQPWGVHADSARCLRLVAFWVNERVCARLPPSDQADFALVGPADVDLSAGGVRFFDELDALEAERLRAAAGHSQTARALALELSQELALFLLEQGFQGVYLGSAARLEPIKARLRQKQLPVAPELPRRQPLEPRTSWARIALLAGLVLGFYGCCAWASAGWGSG
jgi:hypothetical protein